MTAYIIDLEMLEIQQFSHKMFSSYCPSTSVNSKIKKTKNNHDSGLSEKTLTFFESLLPLTSFTFSFCSFQQHYEKEASLRGQNETDAQRM